jgi:hypothetical protein
MKNRRHSFKEGFDALLRKVTKERLMCLPEQFNEVVSGRCRKRIGQRFKDDFAVAWSWSAMSVTRRPFEFLSISVSGFIARVTGLTRDMGLSAFSEILQRSMRASEERDCSNLRVAARSAHNLVVPRHRLDFALRSLRQKPFLEQDRLFSSREDS